VHGLIVIVVNNIVSFHNLFGQGINNTLSVISSVY